jgi:hypothetical protein
VEKTQDEVLVECWDYNVEQLASNSHLANAVLQLQLVDWTVNKTQNLPVKLRDSNGQEVGEIHFQITISNLIAKEEAKIKKNYYQNNQIQENKNHNMKNQMSER